MSWSHDWYSYDNYRNVHDNYMQQLMNEGVVVRDRLTIHEVSDGDRLVKVQIEGDIECKNDLMVSVNKWLDVRKSPHGRDEVKGCHYSYHTWIRGPRQPILRYDCAHGEGVEGLHRHYFDPSTGTGIQEPISLHELPTLEQFIREALALKAD